MRKVFSLLGFILSVVAIAQPPRNFYRTIGGVGDDIAYSCKVTLDGNYIIAGATSSYGDESTNFYLVKLDSIGNGLWDKYYGGAGNDVAKAVIQIPDSSYVLAGYTSSFGAGGYDAYVIRVSKTGELLWSRTFGGTDWDFANDLVLGSDKNLYVAGYTSSFGNGLYDGFIWKLDTAGTTISTKYFGGSLNDELRSIIRTNDGNLVAVGLTESRGEANGDLYFLKLNLNLDTLLTKTMGGTGRDYADDVTQHPNGEYYISGAKTFSDNVKTQSYMHRLDVNCQFLSDEHFYRGTIDESFVSVASSKSTQIPYLTGFARTVYFTVNKLQAETFVAFPAGNYHIINANGATADEYVYSIEATNDRGFVSVGATNGYGARGKDIYFMKQDSTIINYAMLLGVEKIEKFETKLPYYYENQTLTIDNSNLQYLKIELYNCSGIKVCDISMADVVNYQFRQQLEDKGIYVLRLYNKSGTVNSYKVITGIN